LPFVVLDKAAFPLGQFLLVSHRACAFEVRLGLTLQKGVKDVVSDEHARLPGGERKTSNMSVSLPKRPSLRTSSTERMQLWPCPTARAWSPLIFQGCHTHVEQHTMTWTTAYQKRHAKARQRQRRTAAERLQRDRAQAQRAIEALEQALHDVGLPD